MTRKLFFYLFLTALSSPLLSPGFALEKMKLGSPVKMAAIYYLPVEAEKEKSFWKTSGLEVEWVPFAAGAPLMRSAAAGAINFGLAPADLPLTAAARGVPVVMVAEFIVSRNVHIWVMPDSPYRQVRDLKGRRIGVTRLGGTTQAYARIITKAHGLEKDVRFVGAGGTMEAVAGLRAGAFDALTMMLSTVANLKVEGKIREIASLSDYLPTPWVENVMFARKDFARSKPEVIRNMIKATLQAIDFIRKNPRWSVDKIMSIQGLSEEAAKLVYNDNLFTITGKLERQAVENLRRLFIEYGILPEKAPTVDELFTNEYLPG